MTEAIATYTTRVSGFWTTRHEFSGEEGRLGVLTMQRNWHGMVFHGEYRPEKGEVLTFRRDPGLLRSQFSMWTDGSEWLGASLRWSPVRREVSVNTGGKPFLLVPTAEFGRGWRLEAPKTGMTARMRAGIVGRDSTLEVFRRMDFPLLVFTYFLGAQIYSESLLPGPSTKTVPA